MVSQYVYQSGSYKMNIRITKTRNKCIQNYLIFFNAIIMLSFIFCSPCERLPSYSFLTQQFQLANSTPFYILCKKMYSMYLKIQYTLQYWKMKYFLMYYSNYASKLKVKDVLLEQDMKLNFMQVGMYHLESECLCIGHIAFITMLLSMLYI